jgi:regulator of replication initiation timing
LNDFLQPFIQEAITIAQFEDTLEERNKEIKSLKEEVVKLKEELHNVKTRNKKLCNILALGESKQMKIIEKPTNKNYSYQEIRGIVMKFGECL